MFSRRQKPVFESVILGAGMGGCTCALYLGDANIHNVLVTGPSMGALQDSPSIRNFPAQSDVSGLEIMQRVRDQAQAAGSWVLPSEMRDICLVRDPEHGFGFRIVLEKPFQEIYALTLVIAMGSKPRKHEARNVDFLWGHGVYSCAVCDGVRFRDQPVVVVGGGDAAVGMASYLSNLASDVFLLLRGNTWKAKDLKALEKLLEHRNVHVLKQTLLTEVIPKNPSDAKQGVKGVVLTSAAPPQRERERERRILDAEGIFLAIGSDPLTRAFEDALDLDEDGFIVVNERQETNLPGVFAAGEICTSSKPWKQAVTASDDGCKASFGVREFLGFMPSFLLSQMSRAPPRGVLVVSPKAAGAGVAAVAAANGGGGGGGGSSERGWTEWNQTVPPPGPAVLVFHQHGCLACERMLNLIPPLATAASPSVRLYAFNIEDKFKEADQLLRQLLHKDTFRLQKVPITLFLGKDRKIKVMFDKLEDAETIEASLRKIAKL